MRLLLSGSLRSRLPGSLRSRHFGSVRSRLGSLRAAVAVASLAVLAGVAGPSAPTAAASVSAEPQAPDEGRLGPAGGAAEAPWAAGVAVEAAAARALRVDRGDGEAPVWVPRDERLDFEVFLDLGILGETRVGRVVLRHEVEPWTPALPGLGAAVDASVGGDEPEPREVAHLSSHASGRYLGQSLDHDIDVRLFPQVWPRTVLHEVQTGSSNRKRELSLGLRGAEPVSEFRRDHHCRGCKRKEHYVESAWPWGKDHHCDDCDRRSHRVWKPIQRRSVPADTVDMLSGICLARTLVSEGERTQTFPLANKDDLWMVTLTRSDAVRHVETPSGTFRARRVELRSDAPPGEDKHGEEFEGLFGIQGDIRIYLHESTGVPVVIEGDVPVGPLQLAVRVKLVRWQGTPPEFGPILR